MTGRIVFMAREAGSGAALAPVVRALIHRGEPAPAIVGYAKAADVFSVAELPQLAFSEEPTRAQVVALLERELAPALVTGTSMYPNRDGVFWSAAEAVRVPSIALLDHWVNYEERFSVDSAFDTMPGLIAVMDDAAAAELIRAGCPAERIAVTGQPAFDPLAHSSSGTERERGRRELGISSRRRVVVFASEPQSASYGRDISDAGFLGYVEDDAAHAVIEAVAAIDPEAMLILKLHPQEQPDGLTSFAANTTVEVRVLRSYPSRLLISAADVVCGMTSVFLLEAALAGKPTLSVRPGGGENHYLSVHRDLIESVTDREDITNRLATALAATPSTRPTPAFALNATERVLELIRTLS